MARNRTTDQDVILFREYLHHFKPFHGHFVLPHAATHAHAFEYTARIGRVTDGTRGALAVMLPVRLLAHTAETMALYNTLESLALGGTYHFNAFPFGENVNSDGFTNVLI